MIAACGELIEVWTGGLISTTAAEPRRVVLSVGGRKAWGLRGSRIAGAFAYGSACQKLHPTMRFIRELLFPQTPSAFQKESP